MARYFFGLDVMKYYDKTAKEAFLKYKPKSVMISFYYAKKCGLERLETVFKLLEDQGTEIYLDSGAYSLMAAQRKGRNTDIDLDEYTEMYAAFIKKHRKHISRFFELDVQSVVGNKEYERLREKLINLLDGEEPTLVWHIFDPIEKFAEYCERVGRGGFFAIGGVASTALTGSKEVARLLRQLVMYARARGIEIHGLGITSRISRYIDFNSVDSFTYIRPITDNMAYRGKKGLVSEYGYSRAWMLCVARAKLEQLIYETY